MDCRAHLAVDGLYVTWASAASLGLTALFVLSAATKAPRRLGKLLPFFKTFIKLEEAEALYASGLKATSDTVVTPPAKVQSKTLWLAVPATVEACAWIGLSCYALATSFVRESQSMPNHALFLALFALSWVWAALRPFYRPKPTPRYDLFAFYVFHFAAWAVFLGGSLYRKRLCVLPGFTRLGLAGSFAHTIAIVIPLLTLLSMPIGVPRHASIAEGVNKTISPEDYVSLFSWLTFTWVDKITQSTIEKDEDVWELSPMLSLRAVYPKFRALAPISYPIVRRVLKAGSLDIIIDATLSIATVIFDYASPFFLKLILDCVTVVTTTTDPFEAKKARTDAFVYAVLLLLCTFTKALTDLQHLWFARRGSTRMKADLCALIYEKALKRQEFAAMNKRNDGPGKENEDDSADLGKIVNLMSSDTRRVENFLLLVYFYYTVPLQLVLASVFLYKLMGWTAFSGIAIFCVVIPLNTYVSNIMMGLYRKLLKARDARMSVVNELVSEVRFIKFFASEDLWIGRAQESRGKELKLMIKTNVVGLVMTFLWVCAPLLVTLTTFFVFVYYGGRLTVSLAFPALQLFAMLQRPLALLPWLILQLVQLRLAIGRITTFLEEPNVPDFVSTLERSASEQQANGDDGQDKLGIEKGHFRWNESKKTSTDAAASRPWWKVWAKKTAPADAGLDTPRSGTSTPKPKFELRDIDVIFPDGKLTVVTGPTASGKTALLYAVLGEMEPLDLGTKVHLPKDTSRLDTVTGLRPYISYAAQTAWLEHLTIKDNILFGSEFEQDRYDEVLECCALKPDLKVLEDGDQTEIGARGISLSGGQKARVALARAVYARSKYVLLDDPLSAVDSHTARFLYERLLQGPLLANRTVVLVTHHLELVLPGTHYVVRMLEGRIAFQGPTDELLKSNRLSAIIPEIREHQEDKKDDAEKTSEVQDESVKEPAAPKNPPRKLVEEEKRATGSVKWFVYRDYFKATSPLPWILIFLAIIAVEAGEMGEKVWMQIWGEAYAPLKTTIHAVLWQNLPSPSSYFANNIPPVKTWTALPSADEHPFFYISVYAAISLGAAMLSLLESAVTVWCSYRAAKALFSHLLNSVIHATMRWHDTTPAGRILNRFSKDFETIDSSIADSTVRSLSSVFGFIFALLAIVIIAPAFIGPAILISLAYFQLSRLYLRAQRSLKRLESTSNSPIFATFRETLEGITTIRAFSAERRFLKTMMDRLDNTNKFYYAYWMVNRWVMARFDWLGAASVFTIIMLVLYRLEGPVEAIEGTFTKSPADGSKSGFAGLLILSAMGFMMSVYWACRNIAELELQLNSVERVIEYLEVPQEPPARIENNKPPAYWPSTSSNNAFLKVEKLVVKYAPELPAVLHGVSFEVKAREKIGLLGRTGSGKSTLAMSLMRFVDPSEGQITLDGIDVTTIGLNDLRSTITFIPQESVLFSGTVRDNLDPFKQYEDEACLEALKRVHLVTGSSTPNESTTPSEAATLIEPPAANGSATADSPATANGSGEPHKEPDQAPAAEGETGVSVVELTTEVASRGTNLSQGQRQLISLARAVLRRAPVVIMDEATSSIDFETDTKIQATLREEFKDACVITVAHRLKTVIDYDRLIVLDNGKIVEEGTPWDLLQIKEGVFRGMCSKSGMLAELEADAQTAHEKR